MHLLPNCVSVRENGEGSRLLPKETTTGFFRGTAGSQDLPCDSRVETNMNADLSQMLFEFSPFLCKPPWTLSSTPSIKVYAFVDVQHARKTIRTERVHPVSFI
jgi:hypothetical protein